MTISNARVVRNKVIAALPENEREDHIVAETRHGYMIVTDYRVIEVYQTLVQIYVQERQFEAGQGWDAIEMEGD